MPGGRLPALVPLSIGTTRRRDTKWCGCGNGGSSASDRPTRSTGRSSRFRRTHPLSRGTGDAPPCSGGDGAAARPPRARATPATDPQPWPEHRRPSRQQIARTQLKAPEIRFSSKSPKEFHQDKRGFGDSVRSLSTHSAKIFQTRPAGCASPGQAKNSNNINVVKNRRCSGALSGHASDFGSAVTNGLHCFKRIRPDQFAAAPQGAPISTSDRSPSFLEQGL